MSRNIQFQVLRGALANIPSLGDGEFYLATDTGGLYVGFSGGNLQVAQMGVQIQDPTTGTQIAAVQAKGTQGSFMLCVQDAKDTGRTKVVLTSTKVAAIATEALLTLTIKKGTATTTTASQYTVTTGKILRIQSIFVGLTSNSAAVINTAVRLREGAAGGAAVSATSDIVSELEAGTTVATSGVNVWTQTDFPDGLEITSGQQLGVTELSSGTTGLVTVVVVGFEY